MGLIGAIRSIGPVLRVIMGLGMMFVLPWLWMIIFAFLIYGSMTSSYSVYGSQDIMGTFLLIMIIQYGGAALFFIVGIVMTISGIMDWWSAKQEKS